MGKISKLRNDESEYLAVVCPHDDCGGDFIISLKKIPEKHIGKHECQLICQDCGYTVEAIIEVLSRHA